MPKIAILGFGRIGRSLMRVALKDKLFVPVSISEIKDVPTLAASVYDTAARTLADVFRDNFKKYESGVSTEITAAGPV
jgi:glyceraldehyde-3-phosphate dehydrogenase/erythrose-4-phosphate dehydrogenase